MLYYKLHSLKCHKNISFLFGCRTECLVCDPRVIFLVLANDGELLLKMVISALHSY